MRKMIIIFCLFFSPIIIHPQSITHSSFYDFSKIEFSRLNNYDIITIFGLEVTTDVGHPQLPLEVIQLQIPLTAEVRGITIEKIDTETLQKKYLVLPVQEPQPYSLPGMKTKPIPFTEADPGIYQSNAVFPEKIVEFRGCGYMGNKKIATFFVYPMQYIPAVQQLIFHREIRWTIDLEPKATSAKYSEFRSAYEQALDGTVRRFVQNADQYPLTAVSSSAKAQENDYPYLIITSKSLANEFQALANWKTKKGVPTKIMTVDSIFANYVGFDQAERMRNFIKYARDNWGTLWVLLGGDVNIVPYRKAFAMDCKMTNYDPNANNIPCDLYFSDLDGTWDENKNRIYGEVADAIEMYPDVFVGRASVDNTLEAKTFVKKILAYEKAPNMDYQQRMLFAADILWNHPYTDNGIAKDMIESESALTDYDITKLYGRNGNLNITSVMQALNKGTHIFNHNGHAWTDGMSVGSGSLDIRSMLSLINGLQSTYTICFSIGCYPANFEDNSVAEAFINNQFGGGVAFVGNSRFGWGSPGNPGYGYSERYDNKFFKYLFHDKNIHIGEALALAKMFHIPYAQQENVHRWCMYELNLLGDPEMPVWTERPDSFTISHPDTIPTGDNDILVTVVGNDAPVSDALVCLMQTNGIYDYGKTSATGQILFPVTVTNVADEVNLTVTAMNFLPYEGKIKVQSDGAYVSVAQYAINDGDDELLNPGETSSLKMMVRNYGNQATTNLTATISTQHAALTIHTNTVDVGQILAQDSVLISNAFSFSADESSQDGLVVPLSLQIVDSGAKIWRQRLPITIAAPRLSIADVRFDDGSGGNGNGIPEAGESFDLVLSLQNQGLAPAQHVRSSAPYSENSYVTVVSKTGAYGERLAYEESGVDSFHVSIDHACPQPAIIRMYLDVTVDDRWNFPLHFDLAIGKYGFQDNMEQGENGWHRSAKESSLWHLSTIRSHSPSYSWYCGKESDTTYTNSNLSELFSPTFCIGPKATLSFWLWFDVAIYSVDGYKGDGLYVLLYDGQQYHTLDFIGTGGALDPVLIECGWCQYTYDLSDFAPCTNAQLKFEFISDPFSSQNPEFYQGVFLDDICVTASSFVDVAAEEKGTLPEQHELKNNYPNPFNQHTIFEYSIAGKNYQLVRLEIYNILGQKVKTVVNMKQSGGNYQARWDGTDESEQKLVSGIYIYQLRVADFKTEKKLVILR